MSKLDELCATEVMGWSQEWQGYQGYHGREPPIGIMWWKGDMPGTFFNRYAYINNTTDSLCQPVVTTMFAKPWNPSTCLDDALLVINKVSRRWQLDTWEGTLTQRYSAGIYDENGEEQYGAQGDSAAIVLCLTALRASGVPESLITQAME